MADRRSLGYERIDRALGEELRVSAPAESMHELSTIQSVRNVTRRSISASQPFGDDGSRLGTVPVPASSRDISSMPAGPFRQSRTFPAMPAACNGAGTIKSADEDAVHEKKDGRTSIAVKSIDDSVEDGDHGSEHQTYSLHHKSYRRPLWESADKSQIGASQRAPASPKLGVLSRLKEAWNKVASIILGQKVYLAGGDGRQIEVDILRQTPLMDPRTGAPYINNMIRSSKYSLVSFLPRQLFFQFSKLANVYFLFISILQLIPGLSTTGTFTTIIPLLIFISVSMAKEGYEDFRRHKLDNAENTSSISRVKSNTLCDPQLVEWQTLQWQQLRVGDLVRVCRDEAAPADLVILHVQGTDDLAYVETMALDGETNLKNKSAPTMLVDTHQSAPELANMKMNVHVEEPNLDLYNFSGNITLGGEKQPLTNNEIIYRGSILRNTSEILALVIYSGEECKIRMNATKNPRIKAPVLQAVVNRVVVFIIFLVLALALGLTVGYIVWKPKELGAFYIHNASVKLVPIFMSFVILLNTMIPLSLYVSMEIVKLVQINFMMSDVEMYDPATNTPMEARTSTINEELGQVSFVFSDKTGTLTDNIMKFRKLSVAGTAWHHEPDTKTQDLGEGFPKSKLPLSSVQRTDLVPLRSQAPSIVAGRTEELLSNLRDFPSTPFAKTVRFFLLSIALCHTCMSEKSQGKLTYQAKSPDEIALVQAAQEMGFIFLDRKGGIVTIRTISLGVQVEETFQVLQVLEFTSKRKRMSLVVRMPDGRVCLFSKGADTTIRGLLRLSNLAKETEMKVERRATLRRSIEAQDFIRRRSIQQARHGFKRTSMTLARVSLIEPLASITPTSLTAFEQASHAELLGFTGNEEGKGIPAFVMTGSPVKSPTAAGSRSETYQMEDLADADVFEKCFEHIDHFATDGLRTLLYAYRYVDESEFLRWNKMYMEASTSLVDRQENMDKAAERIEHNLELAGATAIEDKLQDGVPLTIDRLRRAGIKVWILTGDKRETAMNIGRSCSLIKDFSTVSVLDHEVGDVFLQIQASIKQMRNAVHSVVVVDGQTLALIEADPLLFDFFHALAIFVDSVLCCRASPSQKASLVRSVRERVLDSVTLAIGDGSNDVAMLQEAHVGIGIAGREGLQAARSSDYSIAQFRFLARLLLVHGRWNYVRICKYTLGTFWKETLFYLTQAMYQRYNGYTGTSLYESWSLSMFNTLFTSLPVLFLGIFEKDLRAETLLAAPELYNYGQQGRGFNLKLYLGWSILSTINAALIFWLALTLYGAAESTRDNGLFALGSMCYVAAVVVINTKLQFWEIHSKSLLNLLALVLSIGGWFLWNILLAYVYHDTGIYDVRDGITKRFGRNAGWWLALLLIISAVWLVEIGVKMFRATFRPSDVDTFQALEKDACAWDRIQCAARGELVDPAAQRPKSLQRMRSPEEQAKRDAEWETLLAHARSGSNSSRKTRVNVFAGWRKRWRRSGNSNSNSSSSSDGGASDRGYEMMTLKARSQSTPR